MQKMWACAYACVDAGDTYLRIVAAAKAGAPDIHVHAFSPLEVTHGSQSLGLSLDR